MSKVLLKKKKLSILPIFLTVFIDLLGVGIIIPILAPIFFTVQNGVLPEHYTFFARAMLLGVISAAYPFAQFFGAPILGGLSDRIGRKKVLLMSLSGTLLGYILFASGIVWQSLFLMIVGRVLDGFTGGNISTALSAIADVSDEKEKTKNFGLIGMAFGMGFILGPYIGGKLADPNIQPWFTIATPFWFAAVLTFINIILVIWRFRETLKTRVESEVSLLTGFRNIGKAWHMGNLRTMFIVSFLLSFGFAFYTQFFQVFLIDKFHYNQSQIGDLFGYIGLWIAITQGGINRPIAKRFKPTQVLRVAIVVSALIFPILLIPNKAIYLFFILPFQAICQGLIRPNSTTLVSNMAGPESQGEILGISQSIESLAISIPPLIAGLILAFSVTLPTLVAGFCTFIAWVIFVRFFKHQEGKRFHEI